MASASAPKVPVPASALGPESGQIRVNLQDTEFVRSTFRSLIQRVVLLGAGLGLLHALLFYLVGEGVWVMCAVVALSVIPLYWMTAVGRPFLVFLLGLGLILGVVLVYVTVLSGIYGHDAGFHYLLLIIVPLLMVSGRVSLTGKWILVVMLIAFIIWLDQQFKLQLPQDGAAEQFQSRMHAINFATILILLALLTQYHFLVIVRTQGQLQKLASTDPLTGLYNRRRLLEVAALEVAQSQRYGRAMSFILADLDHFKAVNDRFGHDSGDLVLRHASTVIRDLARETDCVCRWGGEEFLILLPNTNIEGAMSIAERICEHMARTPAKLAQNSLPITLTLGVATLQAGERLDRAIGRADAALYEGKAAGRNRAVMSQA